jgi:hypothetical protein
MTKFVEMYTNFPYECAPSSPFERLGVMFHWGVSPPPHHVAWEGHRAHEGTDDNRLNIFNALSEYQKRAGDSSAIIIFHSNLWDAQRYVDFFLDNTTTTKFKNDFERDYREVVTQIKAKMRPQDTLLLGTSHIPVERLSTYTWLLNDKVRLVARELKLDIFDEYYLINKDCRSDYLSDDGLHQNGRGNQKYVEYLLEILKK